VEPGVERFNSPYSRRGLRLGVWLVWLAGFGLSETRDVTDGIARLAWSAFIMGIMGLVMSPLVFLAPHEVTIGPGTLVVRSWWQALRRRPGRNEWVEPRGSWLWRSPNGACLVLPAGPRLGVQLSPVVAAFERLGFEIRDEAAAWERTHATFIRREGVLTRVGVLLGAVAWLAWSVTGDIRFGLLAGAAVVLLFGLSLIEYRMGRWRRFPLA
jgi:hypothetical protein